MKITPRKFCDSARSGWRASIASSCLRASGKLVASNSRNALSYIASSSVFEGATLLAAKELSTRIKMTAILRIFIEGGLELSHRTMTSLNFDATTGKSMGSRIRAGRRLKRAHLRVENDQFGFGSKGVTQ